MLTIKQLAELAERNDQSQLPAMACPRCQGNVSLAIVPASKSIYWRCGCGYNGQLSRLSNGSVMITALSAGECY